MRNLFHITLSLRRSVGVCKKTSFASYQAVTFGLRLFIIFAANINTTLRYESKKPYLRSRNPAFRGGLQRTIEQ